MYIFFSHGNKQANNLPACASPQENCFDNHVSFDFYENNNFFWDLGRGPKIGNHTSPCHVENHITEWIVNSFIKQDGSDREQLLMFLSYKS